MEGLYIIIIAILLFYGINYYLYSKTEYYFVTRTPFLQIFHDYNTGKKGEFLLYQTIKKIPGYKKYLFNCYIPKEDGTTSEIDLIFIHASGIYVFESKNYNGWIFGTETMQEWTQTIKKEEKKTKSAKIYKNKFFNPIMQNKTHIKHLKAYISEFTEIPIHSYIVFGNGCELKSITLTTKEHKVINRRNVAKNISIQADETPKPLSKFDIDNVYYKLYRTSQASEFVKQEHIENIKNAWK